MLFWIFQIVLLLFNPLPTWSHQLFPYYFRCYCSCHTMVMPLVESTGLQLSVLLHELLLSFSHQNNLSFAKEAISYWNILHSCKHYPNQNNQWKYQWLASLQTKYVATQGKEQIYFLNHCLSWTGLKLSQYSMQQKDWVDVLKQGFLSCYFHFYFFLINILRSMFILGFI